MKLTQEQMDMIIDKAADGTVFEIHGFNADGLPFKTEARLSYGAKMDPKFKIFPRIQEEGIVFEFGKKQGVLNRTYDLSAVFLTEYDPSEHFDCALIINEIKTLNGETILKNPDAEKYREVVYKQTCEKNAEKELRGQNLNNLDPVTYTLTDMIGQPVLVDNAFAGVLMSIDSIANDGSVVIMLSDGYGIANGFIQKNTKVSTMDLSGKVIPVVENSRSLEDKEKMNKLYEARLKHMAEKTNNQKQPQ